MPILDGDFPASVIPAKGVPGSAKTRISLRLRTPNRIGVVAAVAARNLQRALEASQAAPEGLGRPEAVDAKGRVRGGRRHSPVARCCQG